MAHTHVKPTHDTGISPSPSHADPVAVDAGTIAAAEGHQDGNASLVDVHPAPPPAPPPRPPEGGWGHFGGPSNPINTSGRAETAE